MSSVAIDALLIIAHSWRQTAAPIPLMDNAKPEEMMAAIKDAILHGQKITAIKFYREATGLGLAEAKEAIERLEAELRSSSPAEFKKVESRGCLGVLLIVLLAAGGIVCFTLRSGSGLKSFPW